ncbi:MAG TPA: DUF1800 domain-containing protein [Trichormus sp.]|jgi:uncharacterized protein (DUF1800 family)
MKNFWVILFALAFFAFCSIDAPQTVEASGSAAGSTPEIRAAKTPHPPGAAAVHDRSAPSSPDQVIHILNRLSFGPRPGEIERVQAMGIWQYVNEQLNPQDIPDRFNSIHSGPIEASRRNPIELLAEYNQMRAAERTNAMNYADNQVRGRRVVSETKSFYRNMDRQYVTAKLQRAIDSPRQLQEVLTEFWYQHFNVCINKDIDRAWVGPYEDQAIRPYALGRFRDLLGATCHHPAMLFYLDNWQNTAPQSKGAKGNQKGLNENYARELMELHTLGVDGGYTQKDVIELARILTGLGFSQTPKLAAGLQPVGNLGATFDPSRHDFGDKTLLGRHFSGRGEAEVEEALDMLARHPSTARYISFKMAQYFVADSPPRALVDRMAKNFLATDGDIKSVMTTMLHSPEFWAAENQNNKYKTPLRFVVSSVRAVGLAPQNYDPLIDMLRQQGEAPYAYLTPDGYKNTKDAWLNPDSLLKRINFATTFGSGALPGNRYSPPEYRRLGATIAGGRFSPQTVATIAAQPEELRSPLLLGSPEFMRY